ncbi:MAG: hypothetical protein ACLRXQ_01175 [Phascolarctobacterium faecium]
MWKPGWFCGSWFKNDKELYNKKYVMKAEDSTDYFFIGSGSVAQR